MRLVLLALLAGYLAAALPLSAPIPGERGYVSMDQAAVAAENCVVGMGVKIERAGIIYEQGGEFYFTAPATNDDGDNFHISVSYPSGAKLVALYHDHPEHLDNDRFSPPDILVANQLHVVSYVAVIDGDQSRIIRYTPGRSEIYHLAGGGWDTASDLVSDGTVIAKLELP